MVDISTVNSDSSEIKNTITSYKSSIEQLDASWKGNAHDTIIGDIETFTDEYLSTLEEQATAFAKAVELYENFTNQKNEYNAKVDEVNAYLKENNDNAYENSARRQLESKAKEINNIETQIRDELNKVTSKKLEASKINISIPRNYTTFQNEEE